MSRLPPTPAGLVPGLCALILLAAPPSAQAFKTEGYPEKGLEVQRPRRYVEIPVQPTERWIVVRYVEEVDPRNQKPFPPELAIVRIDWAPDPEPVPEPEAEPAPPPPITTLERYAEQELAGLTLGSEIELEQPLSQGAYALHEYLLEPKGKDKRRGYAFAWRSEGRTYAVLGTCAEANFADEVKTWRVVAEKLAISEPVESKETAKWRRFYEKRPEFTAPEFRLRIRDSAVKGWEVDDSENFILIYSTTDEALIRSLKQRLESIRKAYLELFPPARALEAVSAVRICRDAQEYKQYGGPPGSGGYWHAPAEELVFFDYADKKGDRGSGKEDSLIVLYHEAFHQYIYYSVGELAPHSWFNEGYGDYFSGAVLNAYGEVQKIGVNPWRIGTIQRAIEEYQFVPWGDIIKFEQPQYYNPSIRHICYAQGWSMIYFLNQSPEVRRHAQWSRILPTYFETLKEEHQKETAALAATGLAQDDTQRFEAAARTRAKAVEAAFAGVDLGAIERAWLEFTKDLKAPK